jgi:hypothetical protein
MADYDSSLPIRTEENGDVVTHLADGTVNTQLLKVNADGSIDTNTSLPVGTKVEITDGTDDLEINADGSINVKDDDLTFANDKVDVSGSSVTATVSATDLDIRDLTSASDSVEVLQDTHDDLNCNANLQVGDADVTALNPVPVTLTSDQQGNEIVDFNSSAAVAKDASVNHDYTVTAGKTFLGEEAFVSGSGKLKVELIVNGSTKYVGFNSTANPNIRIPLEKILKANAAEVVRFTITNRDKQAQDVYSTLSGLEV